MATPPRRTGSPASALSDLLGQKSMLTPALAGATTTVITATLSSQFGLPANWTGLVVSLALAFVLLTSQKLSRGQRLGFGVMNGLVIFSVALGANTAGVAAVGNAGGTHVERAETAPVTPPASQPSPGGQPGTGTVVPPPPAVALPPRATVPRQAVVQKQFFHHWLETH